MATFNYRGGVSRRSMLALGSAGLAGLAGLSADPASAAASEVVIGKDGWLFPAFDQVSRVDYGRIRQETALINEAVGILKQGNIKVLICLTPSKSRVYSDFLPENVKFNTETLRRYQAELEELRRPGTLVPDLAAAMSAARKADPAAPLFFKGDTHWTPRGAACAVEAIAEAVKSDAALPPSTKPGSRLGVQRDTVQSKNDLANLLPPEERGKYPLQPYKLPQAVDDGEAGLLAEEGADTVLVGNSYLHPSFGFSVMLSNKLNRPTWLVWKIHSYSPYWNLLDYLNSSAFKNQRPKLIVWIFHETDLTIPPNNTAIWGQTAMKPEVILSDLRRRVTA